MAPQDSPYRVDVVYYAGDNTGEKWSATYHSRVKADKAISRAADVLGWIGVVVREDKP
jgi:hypothetical protein